VRLAAEHAGDVLENNDELFAIERYRQFAGDGSAYAHFQATRPQTLSYALSDSPIGQLALIAEKFHEWADPSSSVSDDDLLTAATIYWVTGTAGSAARWYQEEYGRPAPQTYVSVPTAVTLFPADIVPAIRVWAEKYFRITRWVLMPEGGHFPAIEQPALLVATLRAFAASIDSLGGKA